MSVSLESARGRKEPANLNLVPFIDLLTVCITFLIATAVWIEVASVPVDQQVGSGSAGPVAAPLTVHLALDGVRVGREEQVLVPRIGGDIDWVGVDERIATDRDTHPVERGLVLRTDDGLPYRDVIRALDLATAHDYDQPVLAGGPSAADP